MTAFLLIVAIGFALLCLIASGHGRRLSTGQLAGLLAVATVNAGGLYGAFWLMGAFAS